MRALIQDIRWSSRTNGDLLVLTSVGRPTTPGNMRDFWFRFASDAASTSLGITVHKTREDARAGASPIGTVTTSLGAAAELVILNVGATAPDVTGLTIELDTTAATDEEILAVWGYTATPDLVALDDAVEILSEYMGEGGALADYGADETTRIGVGDPGTIVPHRYLYAITETIGTGSSVDTRQLGTSRYTLKFMPMRADPGKGPSDVGLIEALQRRLRVDQAAIWSILTDERRTWDGLIPQGGVSAGFERPSWVQMANGHWMAAATLVQITLPTMRSDY